MENKGGTVDNKCNDMTIAKNLTPALEQAAQTFAAYDELAGRISDNLIPAFKQAAEAFAAYDEFAGRIINNLLLTMQNAYKLLSPLLDEITLPIENDKSMAEIKTSYIEWGKLGWTEIPHAKMKLFYNFPKSKHIAEKSALEYFDELRLSSFFDMIVEASLDNKDLLSAIFCYKNQQYKACALLVFSLIDYTFSVFQEPQTNDIGCNGIKKTNKAYKAMLKKREYSHIMLRYSGLIIALFRFYAGTEDFSTEETDIVNRNFISHGHSIRDVTRCDCIKLFLAYYNLVNLADFYDVYRRRMG